MNKLIIGIALMLLLGVGSAFAEEFETKYLLEFGEGTGGGIELSASFSLNPESDKNKFYLGGFIDVLSLQLDSDFVAGGTKIPLKEEISTVGLGISFFYKEGFPIQDPDFSNVKYQWYIGGGIGYYINSVGLSAKSQPNMVNAYLEYYDGLGENLLSYRNDIMIENGFGFHLEVGIKVALSSRIDFITSYRKNFIKMDMSMSEYAITDDGAFINYYDIKTEGCLTREDMILTGLSINF